MHSPYVICNYSEQKESLKEANEIYFSNINQLSDRIILVKREKIKVRRKLWLRREKFYGNKARTKK